jgi:hypothetical protein
MSMDRARAQAKDVADHAAMLRMLAGVVERHELTPRDLDHALRRLRQTSQRELPWILLRAAAVVRGMEMSPAELAAWLRAAASLKDQ